MAEFDEDDLMQLAFLRDEEADTLIDDGFLEPELRLTSPLDDSVTIQYEEACLTVVTGQGYPVLDPKFTLENKSLRRESIDDLRVRLRSIVYKAKENNNLHKWNDANGENGSGIYEPERVVLRLAQETRRHLDDRRRAIQSRLNRSHSPQELGDGDLSFLDPGNKLAPIASNLSTSTNDLAYQLLSLTPQQILDKVPSRLRVLHMEPVVRPDLLRRFRTREDHLRSNISHLSSNQMRRYVPPKMHGSRAEDMRDYLAKPKLTFHGTQRHIVPSIVRNGFIRPGSAIPSSSQRVEVRCGSTYGLGIYSSPSADFSLSYSGFLCERTPPGELFGVKLIVCATLTGRAQGISRDDNWREIDTVYPGADSHVANDGYECIVFDSSQILPVYVIHLDWAAHNIDHYKRTPNDPSAWSQFQRMTSNQRQNEQRLARFGQSTTLPGDKQRAKEAAAARAAKWFPYGYGPAQGGRFVVEEVGEVSDDEEDYGDYQALRATRAENDGDGNSHGASANRATNTDFWAWINMRDMKGADGFGNMRSDLDQYAEQRVPSAGAAELFGAEEEISWERVVKYNALKSGGGKDSREEALSDGELNLETLGLGEDEV